MAASSLDPAAGLLAVMLVALLLVAEGVGRVVAEGVGRVVGEGVGGVAVLFARALLGAVVDPAVACCCVGRIPGAVCCCCCCC